MLQKQSRQNFKNQEKLTEPKYGKKLLVQGQKPCLDSDCRMAIIGVVTLWNIKTNQIIFFTSYLTGSTVSAA